MIDSVITSIKTTFYLFDKNFLLLLYIYPMIICLIGYTCKTWSNYKKDKIKREKTRTVDKNGRPLLLYYVPTDHVIDIVKRIIISIAPVVNFLALVFDIGTDIIDFLYKRFKHILEKPLVKPYYSDGDK